MIDFNAVSYRGVKLVRLVPLDISELSRLRFLRPDQLIVIAPSQSEQRLIRSIDQLLLCHREVVLLANFQVGVQVDLSPIWSGGHGDVEFDQVRIARLHVDHRQSVPVIATVFVGGSKAEEIVVVVLAPLGLGGLDVEFHTEVDAVLGTPAVEHPNNFFSPRQSLILNSLVRTLIP